MNQPAINRELPDLKSYRFNGKNALQDILRSSVFGTTAQSVASLTKFSHPDTVAQTNNQSIFRVIRWSNKDVDDEGKPLKRGDYMPYDENGRVMLDDNLSPTKAFVWANTPLLREYDDVQFNHVWPASRNARLYTSLANICVTPAFLSKLTDTDTHICAILRYRAYDLYCGFKQDNKLTLQKPLGYDELVWAEPLPPVHDLEDHFRQAIKTKTEDRKNRTVKTIHEVGWLFSGFNPEAT